MSAVLITRAVLVALAGVACAGVTSRPGTALVVFRWRSRHTSGFAPPYDLPHEELRSLVSAECGEMLQLEPAAHDGEQLCWARGVELAALRRACERAIMVHAVYVVSSCSSSSLEDAVAAPCDSRALEIVDLESAHNTRETLEQLRLRVEAAQHTLRPGPASREPSPSVLLIAAGEGARHHLYALGDLLAIGLAGGKGAPGRTTRRRRGGILGQFALDRRPHVAKTTMEPELGFLMSNLAGVRPGARVLDPCCGACGLLLCAAAQGASWTVGVDCDGSSFDGARLAFDEYGLPRPALCVADATDPAGCEALCRHSHYDALLCDPPYGMQAAPRGAGASGSLAPGEAAVHVPALLRGLLRLAADALVPSGRIVFFLPARLEATVRPVEELLGPLLPEAAPGVPHDEAADGACLQLVCARKQRFSETFARWLVVMQKC